MPKKVIVPEDKLRALLRLKASLKDCADFFECSEDTIENRVKEFAGRDVTFSEFRDQNLSQTRFALIQKAISKAKSGDNCMLIFCLKNLCGWRDKPDPDPSQDKKYEEPE